jgi:phosphoribosylanthranilate isomerase
VGSGCGWTVIKAVGVTDDTAADVSAFGTDVLLLVDAHDPMQHGGTGRIASWDSARAIAAERPTILAGGLSAANIRLAVRAVRRWRDVSSGVESAPGVRTRPIDIS